jgi:hypothetical protein
MAPCSSGWITGTITDRRNESGRPMARLVVRNLEDEILARSTRHAAPRAQH